MTKAKIAMLLSTIIVGSNAYAVTMMPSYPTYPTHVLFASGEGGYTWNSINNTDINGVRASKSTEGGTGRIAVGATRWTCNNYGVIGFSGEMGWGYYGKTTFSLPGIDAKLQIYGLDLLVGADYRYNQFDFALKAGGLIEDIRAERTEDESTIVSGGQFTGVTKSTFTHGYVTPAIRVEAGYNFTDDLALFAAYMYVFGNQVSTSINRSNVGDTSNSNNSVTGGPAALNVLTLGLRYSFA